MRRIVVAVLSAAVFAGCAASVDPPTTSSPPEPSPSASADVVGAVSSPVFVGEVPIRSSSLEDQEGRLPAPERLVVPDLDIDMAIDGVGVDDDGAMEIPESAAVAGWYRFGPVPGSDQGNAVIAAHIDDAQIGVGPFGRLRDMEVGDGVVVVTEQGEEVRYEVERVEQTSKQTVDMSVVFDRRAEPHLVLVTCGGRFDWDAGHYEDNVVVWAVPVQEQA